MKTPAAILLLFAAACCMAVNTGIDTAGLTDYNCQCDCNCNFDEKPQCNVDFFILLDAASCVQKTWKEIKLRVDYLAQSVDRHDGGNFMGSSARFGVIRYAQDAYVDIRVSENLNYAAFSEKLFRVDESLGQDVIRPLNEGSFLDKGLEALTREVRAAKVDNRKQIVIAITNGKSHPEAQVDGQVIADLNSMVNGHFYVDTLVPIQHDKKIHNGPRDGNVFLEEEECKACVWNHKLFVREAGLEKHRQVISKDKIVDSMMQVLGEMCHVQQDDEICNNCVCTCQAPVGPQGPIGEPGLPGPDGRDGVCGQPGLPGRDGGPGLDGPSGADGCDGAHGNPGEHGSPGFEGKAGAMGGMGIMGPAGAAGGPGRGQGDQGPIGSMGGPGRAGSPGKDGENGQPGRDGAPGVRGRQGLSGAPGGAGEKGACGQAGARGMDGKPDNNGVDGATGSPGRVGASGLPGFAGKQGVAGSAGAQGRAGLDGQDGAQGAPGVKGMPGATGPRGSMPNGGGLEGLIRQKVRLMLDRLMVSESSSRGRQNEFFCECKAFHLYDVISSSLIPHK